VEDLCFDLLGGGFCGVALGFGHRFGIADNHAGCASEDLSDGPGAFVASVFVGEEDLADALLLGAIVPAAEEGEVVAQEREIAGWFDFFFELREDMSGAGLGGVGGCMFAFEWDGLQHERLCEE